MYFIFAAMSVGIIFVIILFVLSFVILKWKLSKLHDIVLALS